MTAETKFDNVVNFGGGGPRFVPTRTSEAEEHFRMHMDAFAKAAVEFAQSEAMAKLNELIIEAGVTMALAVREHVVRAEAELSKQGTKP